MSSIIIMGITTTTTEGASFRFDEMETLLALGRWLLLFFELISLAEGREPGAYSERFTTSQVQKESLIIDTV